MTAGGKGYTCFPYRLHLAGKKAPRLFLGAADNEPREVLRGGGSPRTGEHLCVVFDFKSA